MKQSQATKAPPATSTARPVVAAKVPAVRPALIGNQNLGRVLYGNGLLQRCAVCGAGPCTCHRDEEKLSRKASAPGTPGGVPASVHSVLNKPGRALDAESRRMAEQGLGRDLSHVRLHIGAEAAQSAREVQAHAYTVGSSIVFGEGAYAPHTEPGRNLLAHELTHVVQQGASPHRGALRIDSPDSPAEREAEALSRVIARGGRGQIRQRSDAVGRIQRAACEELIRAVGTADVRGSGTPTHAAIVAQFPNHENIGIPSAKSEPIRDTCGDQPNASVIEPQVFDENNPPKGQEKRKDHGFPDLFVRGANVASVAEIKPATDGFRLCAEDQVGIYIDHGNDPDNKPWRDGLGIKTVGPMLVQADRPVPFYRMQSGRQQIVLSAWCGPGVVLYKAFDLDDDEKKREKEVRKILDQFKEKPPLVGDRVKTGGDQAADKTPEKETPKEKTPDEKTPDEKTPDEKTPDEQHPDTENPDEEQLPIAARGRSDSLSPTDLVLIAAAVALMRKTAAETIGRVVARRALVYAEAAAMAAMLVLVAEGKAEAKLGPGESPIESLYKAMEQKGVPVPPNVRKLIESDPELKKILEDGAKTGDASKAREQITKKVFDLIEKNPDQFSEQDIKEILTVTQTEAPLDPNAQVTTEKLQKMLEQKRAGKTPSQPSPPATGSSETSKEDTPGLPPEVRQQISNAPEPVQRLWAAIVYKGTTGPKVNADFAKRFLEITKQDPPLTDAEADELAKHVSDAEGKTLDDVLDSVQAGIQTLPSRKPGKPGDKGQAAPGAGQQGGQQDKQGSSQQQAPSGGGDQSASKSNSPRTAAADFTPAGKNQKPKTRADIVKLLVERLAHYKDLPANVQRLVYKPPLKLHQQTFVLVVARGGAADSAVVGGVVSIVPTKDLGGGSWEIEIHPSADLFTASGTFVGTWPSRVITDTLTPVKGD